MKIENKFRVWNKDTNKWHPYADANRIDGSNQIVYLGSFGEWETELSEFVIQQFSGILDVNGNPIFEGDILGLVWTISFAIAYFTK